MGALLTSVECVDIVESTISNTIYVLGSMTPVSNMEMLVTRVTHDGSSIVWMRKYSLSGSLVASSILEAHNGNVLIAGTY